MKIEKLFALHGNRILSFQKPIAKLRENIFFFICVFLEKPLFLEKSPDCSEQIKSYINTRAVN